jgi:hypothetical protein
MPCAGYYGIIISEYFEATPPLSFIFHMLALISLIFVCQLDLICAYLKQVSQKSRLASMKLCVCAC